MQGNIRIIKLHPSRQSWWEFCFVRKERIASDKKNQVTWVEWCPHRSSRRCLQNACDTGSTQDCPCHLSPSGSNEYHQLLAMVCFRRKPHRESLYNGEWSQSGRRLNHQGKKLLMNISGSLSTPLFDMLSSVWANIRALQPKALQATTHQEHC